MDQSVRPIHALDPGLLRAARAALDWGLVEAGQRASISPVTILAAEGKGAKSNSPSLATLDRLRAVYEQAGVRFFDTADGCGFKFSPDQLRSGTCSP